MKKKPILSFDLVIFMGHLNPDVSWCFRVLQTDPELISSYLSRRQEVCCRVEELQRQITQLPISFPCPGTAERRQACLLAHQLCDKSESLQLTLTSLAEQRRGLAERRSDAIWKDSSWAELDTCCSSLMAELKVKKCYFSC